MAKINLVEQLIYLFSKLPGLGHRSARRVVLYLLQDREIRLNGLIEALIKAAQQILTCKICGNLDNTEVCNICESKMRDNSIIAVVETVAELWAIERSEIFKGRYHVLNKTLSASSGQVPADLRLAELLIRCKEQNVKELIIATNSNLEGQTTAYYITEYFKDFPIKITRLASGVPIGGELDYLDEGTLSAAIKERQIFE